MRKSKKQKKKMSCGFSFSGMMRKESPPTPTTPHTSEESEGFQLKLLQCYQMRCEPEEDYAVQKFENTSSG